LTLVRRVPPDGGTVSTLTLDSVEGQESANHENQKQQVLHEEAYSMAVARNFANMAARLGVSSKAFV
jgi:hypothetical protein